MHKSWRHTEWTILSPVCIWGIQQKNDKKKGVYVALILFKEAMYLALELDGKKKITYENIISYQCDLQ